MKTATASAENIAYDGIISLIMKGEVKPGDRLIEQQIGDRLKISRTPVRNAMRSLASEGLLENRGTGGYLLPKLSLKDLNELYRTRFMLEPNIAAFAAENAPNAEKARFMQIIATEREYYIRGEMNMYKLNKMIHGGIAELSGNKYMQLLLDRIYWREEIYILFFDTFYHSVSDAPLLRDPDLSNSHREHREIVESVFSHDPQRAKTTMQRHLTSTWTMLKKNIFASRNGFGGVLISDWDVPLRDF